MSEKKIVRHSSETVLPELAHLYLALLLKGEIDSAHQVVRDALQGALTIHELYLDVFQPVQREVGRLWELNRVSVVEERFCTAATQSMMLELYPQISAYPRVGATIVAACVGPELHELGLRMVVDFFEMEGWDSYYLGAVNSAEQILSAIDQRKPDIVALSSTINHHIPKLREIVGTIRNSLPGTAPLIMVGGAPFNNDPDLWRSVGADLWGKDAGLAVRAAHLIRSQKVGDNHVPPEEAVSIKRFIIACDLCGTVKSVLRNDFSTEVPFRAHTPLATFFDGGSRRKLELFLAEATTNGTALDWELVVSLQSHPGFATLHCIALQSEGRIMVIGADSRLSADGAMEELLTDVNGDNNRLRTLSKDMQSEILRGDRDRQFTDDLIKLNNELATMQRELHKKNQELEYMNHKLEEGKRLFYDMFEKSRAIKLLIDPGDGAVIDANSSAVTFYGYPREQLVAMNISAINIQPADQVKERMTLAALERTSYLRLQHRLASGVTRDVEVYSSPVEKDGRMLLHSIIHDITERKRELRRLSQAIEQSSIAIMITNKRGIIEYVNQKFCEQTGYLPDEVYGNTPRVLKSGVTPPQVYSELWATITAGRSWVGELCNRQKDGSLFWEQCTISPFSDEMGKLSHFIAFREDMTEKKNLAAQLVQSQKFETIGQLVNGLAHDLNNILCIINGNISLFGLNDGKPEKQARYVDEIGMASGRAEHIVNSLLAYSRKKVMNKQRCNLNRLVENSSPLIDRIIGENIVLELVPGAADVEVLVDSVYIEQVLLNIAANARDAMLSCGTLRLETTRHHHPTVAEPAQGMADLQSYAVIVISDTGCGMDKKTLEHIFDPFFTTKEVGKGTGLGLSTSQGIISQHGGYIDVQSILAVGTTFTIYLPIADGKP